MPSRVGYYSQEQGEQEVAAMYVTRGTVDLLMHRLPAAIASGHEVIPSLPDQRISRPALGRRTPDGDWPFDRN